MLINLTLMNYEILGDYREKIVIEKSEDWNNLYSFLPLSFQ